MTLRVGQRTRPRAGTIDAAVSQDETAAPRTAFDALDALDALDAWMQTMQGHSRIVLADHNCSKPSASAPGDYQEPPGGGG